MQTLKELCWGEQDLSDAYYSSFWACPFSLCPNSKPGSILDNKKRVLGIVYLGKESYQEFAILYQCAICGRKYLSHAGPEVIKGLRERLGLINLF
ncbi:MAG: hypothetical protein WC533_02660 [Candidatus Pacearchaeota archaeon]